MKTLIAVLLLALTACAALPSGPTQMVWPAPGKPWPVFQAEDSYCRSYAASSVGISPEQASAERALAGAAVGTAGGAAAGAAIGAATGNPGMGAGIGAGAGLVLGTTAGAQHGAFAWQSLQGRYDRSYLQCMYGHGNQVPGQAPARYAPPPPPPPRR